MHTIKKLAREIHRRSVWQVVAAYLTMSWVGIEGVAFVTERLGLPTWTPAMAAILLAIGFPIVLATAVVQGGLPPWLRIEDVMDPNELVGLTPDEVLVIPHLHPLYGVRLFTWRNAILGGVMALALLVTSVVAYVTMWALGIGPVGSLLAQGLVEESDRVLVVFENRTEEMDLEDDVARAFRADLAQSRVFGISQGAAVAPEISIPRARSMLGSDDVDVLVEGEITRAGSGYLLAAAIVLPSVPSPVARFRETAETPDELIHAIDLLAERVRAKLGESPRLIRADPPLADVYGPTLRPTG